jgi:C4-dicarboxylate-binding protein DctP
MFRIAFVLPALALGLATFAPAVTAQTVTMRLSHQLPTAHHNHKGLEIFAAEVEKNTAGSVKVQLFPAEQAFKATENHAAVARGAIESAFLVIFNWASVVPETNATVIPFLFNDAAAVQKFQASPAARLLDEKIGAKGVRSLGWLYISRSAIYTSKAKPLVRIEDLKGVKIRGLSRIADQGLVAAGAAPSAIPGSEVYQALQSGVLDAGLTDVSAAVSRRYYEIQKYGTVTPVFAAFGNVFVNPEWWGKLTPAQRTGIEAAFKTAQERQIALTEETAGRAVGELRAKGMTVHVHTAAEIEQWKAVMQKPVIDAFLKAAPQDGPKLIEMLQALSK